MKIVVTGGRSYSNKGLVWKVLSSLRPTHLYHGGAAGADSLAESWWDKDRGCEREIFHADWNKYGPSAGPIRNEAMLKYASKNALVIAFDGGRGTENCIKTARSLGMIVLRVEE